MWCRNEKFESYRMGLLKAWGLTAQCASRPNLNAGVDEPADGKLKPGLQKMPSSKRPTKKKRVKKSRPKPPLPAFDIVGNTSRSVTQELMDISDGMSIQAIQSISDNSNPMMGKEGDSYFIARHALNFDGPHSYMMTGGQRAYTAGVDVQRKKTGDMMSANWQGPMLEGVWEKTWNKYLTTRNDFVVSNGNLPQLAQMFPQYNMTIDCKTPEHTARVRLSSEGSTALSLMNQVYPHVALGAKVEANWNQNTSELQIGGRYLKPLKGGGMEAIEGLWNVSAGRYHLWYTKSLNFHSSLTARLQMMPSTKRAIGTFGYRYIFGSRQMGTTVTGEINSMMEFKAAVQVPVVQNIAMRVHGQMNHATANMQQGIFPNRFGLSLVVQV